jgi:hypothetical protein
LEARFTHHALAEAGFWVSVGARDAVLGFQSLRTVWARERRPQGQDVAWLLLIVSRTEPARYQYLKDAFASETVDVVTDRRVAERRRREGRTWAERRRGDQRQLDTTVDLRTFGWALVRAGTASGGSRPEVERRRHPRYPSSWPVRLWVTEDLFLFGLALNVSLHGLCVVRSQFGPVDRVRLGEAFRVDVTPEPRDEVHRVAVIRHLSGDAIGMETRAALPVELLSGR